MKAIYTEKVVSVLEKHSDSNKAVAMKKYMRNRFEYYGIAAPELKKLTKPFLQKTSLPEIDAVPQIVKELWEFPERELQYFAIELMKRYLKVAPLAWIDLYEKLITEKSWWDTVDGLAAWQVGSYFQKYPEQIVQYTERWMASGNIWLQRTCLIFQLKYRGGTDFELMKSFIIPLVGSKEFFIQKAIGWALREYSKLFPEKVMDFASHHTLAPLSYREATRIILK